MKLTRRQLITLIENVVSIDSEAVNNKVNDLFSRFGNFVAANKAKENLEKIIEDLNLSDFVVDVQTFYKGNSGESLIDVMIKDYSFTEKDVMDFFITRGFVPLACISVDGDSSSRELVLKILKQKNKDYKYMVHYKFPDGIIVALEKSEIAREAQQLVASN